MHQDLAQSHGGLTGVRDQNLLDSTLARPLNLYAYENADIVRLAAAYGYGFARNHPFADGNKRIALMAMYTFLGLNGIHLAAEQDDAERMVYQLAAGNVEQVELAEWLEAHCKPRK